MTTLAELHKRHFNPKAGHFDSPAFAAIVAENIRRYLSANLKVPFDTRMVQVVGKYEPMIEFPRHCHVWRPKNNSNKAIVAEIHKIASIMEEDNGQ